MRHSNNVLVLIQPALAGPDVNPLNYWQPQWVLWPPAVRKANGSRLLSVATGDNWAGNAKDVWFVPVDHGRRWQAMDYQDLVARGHFKVRSQMFGGVRTAALLGDTGLASPNAMRIALNADSPVVPAAKISDPKWPEKSLMVAEASGWDQVAEIEKATTGRVLVVEYPPPTDIGWSRYWLKGEGWSIRGALLTSSPEKAVVPTEQGSPVPGLIRAKLLIPLIERPEKFDATAVTLRDWPGANQFLESFQANRPIVGSLWLASITDVVIWGVVLVSNERSGRVLPVFLIWALLSPAIVDLAGLLGRYCGLGGWPVWLLLASFAMTLVATGLGALLRKRAECTQPLLSVFLVGLTTLCIINPVWSFLSPLLNSRQSPVSGIEIASIFGYLAGAVGCLQGSGRIANWAGRVLVLTFFVGGLGLHGWWTEDLGATLFIPVAALVIGEDIFRWQMLIGFALWPSSLVALFVGGFVWAPLGLNITSRGRTGINLANYVDFISSPSLAIFILLAGGTALFGYKFFFHQMKALCKLDRRRQVLPLCALAGAAFGLLHPSFLMSSLVVACGAILALLFDAVQTM